MLEICRTTCRYPAVKLRLLQRANKRLRSRIVTVHVGTGAFVSCDKGKHEHSMCISSVYWIKP